MPAIMPSGGIVGGGGGGGSPVCAGHRYSLWENENMYRNNFNMKRK